MGSISIKESVEHYVVSMKGNDAADKTLKTYLNAISRYAVLNKLITVGDITPATIAKYKAYLLSRTCGATTINLHLAALRNYFRFLNEHKYLSVDYSEISDCKNYKKKSIRKIRGLRQTKDPDKPSGVCISREDRLRLINTALSNTNEIPGMNGTMGERNALMIRVGFVCGLREGDLVNLRVSNFIYDKKKGDWKLEYIASKPGIKVSFHVCNKSLMNAVTEYIKHNELADDDILFKTKYGTAMSERRFWAIFTDIAKRAGVPGVAPHDLRRTCATEMYRSGGVSLKDISLRLGHSSVAVTEKYLRITTDDDDDIKNTRAALSVFD